jgi:hypothetical protein
MDVKKSSEKNNPLLKRKEITFFLDHDSQGTPQLFEVKTAIASMYGVSDDLVYVLREPIELSGKPKSTIHLGRPAHYFPSIFDFEIYRSEEVAAKRMHPENKRNRK